MTKILKYDNIIIYLKYNYKIMGIEGFDYDNHLTGEIKKGLADDGQISQEEANFMVKIIDKYGRRNIKIRKKQLIALGKEFGLNYSKISRMGPKLYEKLKERASLKDRTKNNLKSLKVSTEVLNSKNIYNGLEGESHRFRQLRNRAIEIVEKDFPKLPNNEKKKLFKTIMESQGIKKDCYSFVFYIAKRLKKDLPILNKFLSYNRKYNSKKNGYRGSMTQFLSKFEKAKSIKFNEFINQLKSSSEGSIFLVSMNTNRKPYYEHTGFISIENGRMYFTHGETFKKSGAQGAKKTEIKEKGGYFDSSSIRMRYKKGYFHLKKIA